MLARKTQQTRYVSNLFHKIIVLTSFICFGIGFKYHMPLKIDLTYVILFELSSEKQIEPEYDLNFEVFKKFIPQAISGNVSTINIFSMKRNF